MDGEVTGRRYQQYFNPERDSSPGAFKIHGLSTEFLSSQPRFTERVDEFLKFIQGAELIIHNAPFDVKFINNELALSGHEPLEKYCPIIIDTLKIARECLSPNTIKQKLIVNGFTNIVNAERFFPNSLDNLCLYYDVNLESRTEHHGALIDCALLLEVYEHLLLDQQLFKEQREKAANAALPSAGFFQPLVTDPVPVPGEQLATTVSSLLPNSRVYK